MFKKLKRYLARKLLPYAEITPPKYETTSLDVETVSYLVRTPNYIPEEVYKKELVHRLGESLTDYIKFETIEDHHQPGGLCCLATIRIVKER